MKKLLKTMLIITVFFPAFAFASTSVNGNVTVTYEPGAFSSKPSAEERVKTINKAKISAWEKYTQSFSPSKMKSYRQIESSILGNIDAYIIESNVIDERINSDINQLKLILRVKINTAKFEAKLQEVSTAGSKRTGSGSMFSFVFVARQEDSKKSFDVKRTKITMNEGSGFEKENTSHNSTAALNSNEYKSIKKTTSGGSSVRKSSKSKYRILSSDGINTSMNQALTVSGFEVIDYGDVVSECGGTEPSVIKQEFTERNSITRLSRKNAIKGSRECEVSFFSVGTLDVGMSEVDPVTGNQRVFVSVNAQVWNIDKRLPRKIASVGPVQYQGLGPNEKVAQNNALILAAKSAATEIVNQLNAKGLH